MTTLMIIDVSIDKDYSIKTDASKDYSIKDVSIKDECNCIYENDIYENCDTCIMSDKKKNIDRMISDINILLKDHREKTTICTEDCVSVVDLEIILLDLHRYSIHDIDDMYAFFTTSTEMVKKILNIIDFQVCRCRITRIYICCMVLFSKFIYDTPIRDDRYWNRVTRYGHSLCNDYMRIYQMLDYRIFDIHTS